MSLELLLLPPCIFTLFCCPTPQGMQQTEVYLGGIGMGMKAHCLYVGDCEPRYTGRGKRLHKCRSRRKDSPEKPFTSDRDVEATFSGLDDVQGLEAGVITESRLLAEDPSPNGAEASSSGRGGYASSAGALLYPPAQRRHIRRSWWVLG